MTRLERGKLLAVHTPDDVGPSGTTGMAYSDRRRPIFRPGQHVDEMMADSRVNLALWYLKGTLLSLGRFWIVEGHDPEGAGEPSEIKRFVAAQITRWWRNSASKQLSAIERGWSAHEVMFRICRNQVAFDHLKMIGVGKAAPVTLNGSLVGIAVDADGQKGKIYLACPKGFWHVHWREMHPYWGRSRLYPAFDPWLELSSAGGARDVRRLYYYKSSYQGDTIYHPEGGMQLESGEIILNKDIARELLEKIRSGGVLTLPSTTDAHGNRLWSVEPRVSPDAGGEIDMYVETLKEEINEGIGVPSELIKAAETGSGFSGRKVPQTGFRGTLSELLYWAVADFNEQVILPLVRLNFGIEEPDYEIVPFGLIEDAGDDDPEDRDGNTPETFQGDNAGRRVPDRQARQAQFAVVV